MGFRKRSWTGGWALDEYTKRQQFASSLLTKQNPSLMLTDGSTYIGAWGGGQGGGRTLQDTKNTTLGRTRPLGPIRGDAAPFSWISGPVSAIGLDSFDRNFWLGTNLEVRPIFLESERDRLFNKKKIHPIWSLYAKVIADWSQVYFCSPNLRPERGKLGL